MLIIILILILMLNIFVCMGILEKKTSFFRKCLGGLFVSIFVCLPIIALWIFDYHLTTDEYSSTHRNRYITLFPSILTSFDSINLVLLIAISLLLFLILVWFIFFIVTKKRFLLLGIICLLVIIISLQYFL